MSTVTRGLQALALVCLLMIPTMPSVGAADGDPVITGYVPLVPARLADTRPGRSTVDGLFSGGGAVTPDSPLTIKVIGRGGVAPSGVVAVALNVTVTGATGQGHVTAYPTGEQRPTASNLNFVLGQTVANMVIVKVGTGGQVSLYSAAPSTHLLVDVAGYFTAGPTYDSLTPARLADTRPGRPTTDGQFSGTGPVTPGSPLRLTVNGRGGIPLSGAKAVALNITVSNPTGDGYVSVYPAGQARPNSSNLNFRAWQTVANMVVSKVGTNGQVLVYNSSPSADVVVDVAGYFGHDSKFRPLTPERFADTRVNGQIVDDQFNEWGPIGTSSWNGDRLDVKIAARRSVPGAEVGGAAILNVTVVKPDGQGHVTVNPQGTSKPNASNLNFTPGSTVPNMVIAKIGLEGQVSFNVATTQADIVVDVMGYLPGIPSADVSRSYGFISRDDGGNPVAYNRCEPVKYVINPANAPAGWIDDVHEAFSEVAEASGLNIVYEGTTTEPPLPGNRPPKNPARYGDRYSPVLVAFTTEHVIPGLGGDVIGLGGSVSTWAPSGAAWDPERYRTGIIYFDSDEVLPRGFGAGNAFGKLALHEIGHVVGLDHVNNQNEMMSPVLIDRAGRFGPGDKKGFWFLGRNQECATAPRAGVAARALEGAAPPVATMRDWMTPVAEHQTWNVRTFKLDG